VNPIDVAQAVYEAGFRGAQVVTAVAIIGAETANSWDPELVVVNEGGTRPGSRDRGLWAINDQWHPEVTDEMAFDPVQASIVAYRLSNQGTRWSPWNAYNNDLHIKYLPMAGVAHEAAKRLRNKTAIISGLEYRADNLDKDVENLINALDAAEVATQMYEEQNEALRNANAELLGIKERFKSFVQGILDG